MMFMVCENFESYETITVHTILYLGGKLLKYKRFLCSEQGKNEEL
jgi:hypothetical protein